MKKRSAPFMRNFVFGVEDSLVSTVGLLSGVAIASVPKATIILTGIILIFVEAFSMGVGSVLSEHQSQEYAQRKVLSMKKVIPEGLVMFFSYFLAGFIPLTPYLLFDVSKAFWASIGASLIALFVLGAYSGKLSKTNLIKEGFQMLVIGGFAVAVGVIVGKLLGGF